MSILENAIQAIEVGVQDFDNGSEARLKSAIRNIYAGVLLLFKQKLQELSPSGTDEVLLKQKVVPVNIAGKVSFRGKGAKTVDRQEMEERFKSLEVEVDWKAVDSIGRIRNEIEHYFTTAKEDAIKEALAKAFVVASEFMASELNRDLQMHLSAETWGRLIEIRDFYQAEKTRCEQSSSNFDCESEFAMEHADEVRCKSCYSDLIFFQEEGGAICKSCGKIWSQREIANAIVADRGGDDYYEHVKDGGDPSVIDCPECGEFAFVIAEAYCVSCQETSRTECDVCGSTIPPEEIDGEGRCAHCAYLVSKDD